MIRITALSAALLHGDGLARRETVFRVRIGDRAGRSSGGTAGRARSRPAPNLSAS